MMHFLTYFSGKPLSSSFVWVGFRANYNKIYVIFVRELELEFSLYSLFLPSPPLSYYSMTGFEISADPIPTMTKIAREL